MKKVLVVGDVIVDRYTYGTRLGISAETPTVVAEWKDERKFLGGAGLVARHLAALGCQVDLLTVCGSSIADASGNPAIWNVLGNGWSLTTKHRMFVDDYKLLQYDTINRGRWDENLRRDFSEILARLVRAGARYDALVACDNRHGVFDDEVAHSLVLLSKFHEIPLYVDSQVSQTKESNLGWYRGADYFLINQGELNAFLGSATSWDLLEKMKWVQDDLGGQVILKLGENGSCRLSLDRDQIINYPAHEVRAVDTCGAGDAFLASFVASGDMMEANRWAALSTTYKGTVVPEIKDA